MKRVLAKVLLFYLWLLMGSLTIPNPHLKSLLQKPEVTLLTIAGTHNSQLLLYIISTRTFLESHQENVSRSEKEGEKCRPRDYCSGLLVVCVCVRSCTMISFAFPLEKNFVCVFVSRSICVEVKWQTRGWLEKDNRNNFILFSPTIDHCTEECLSKTVHPTSRFFRHCNCLLFSLLSKLFYVCAVVSLPGPQTNNNAIANSFFHDASFAKWREKEFAIFFRKIFFPFVSLS